MEPKTELSFEEALTKLEQIVERLEKEDVTLEDSVKQFEEGVKLSKYCSKILEEAELRIEQVNQSNTNPS
jgi:exodeoxyribonuclease VII small subunit